MSNDRSYLTSLQDYYARHRALPSYASIGSLLGLRSKSSVAALVARLKLAGFLESTPDRRLAPTRRFFQRPLAESPVQAGLPNPIEDAPADMLTLDDYLIERPSQTVLVRVKGDSMQDAGILAAATSSSASIRRATMSIRSCGSSSCSSRSCAASSCRPASASSPTSSSNTARVSTRASMSHSRALLARHARSAGWWASSARPAEL